MYRSPALTAVVCFCVVNVLLLSTVVLQDRHEVLKATSSHSKTTQQNAPLQKVEEKPAVPTPNSEPCQPMHYFPDPESHPLTPALASFPGSGNTWLRYLLQQATGVYTGAQHTGEFLLQHGFPGEAVANTSVSVVKTHEWGAEVRQHFHRAVLLVREPGPAILAEFNRWGGGHTGFTKLTLFGQKHWTSFFEDHLRDWRLTNLDWLQNFSGPLHVVMYRDLMSNLESSLRALIHFLDLPLDEDALNCTLSRSEGSYHRKPRTYLFSPFSQVMQQKLQAAQEIVFQEISALYPK